jgi:hypothetical protein
MRLHDWEGTIQQMVHDSTQEPNEAGRHKILTKWRGRLEQEPTLLRPYQIDGIVREVRRRLDNSGQ